MRRAIDDAGIGLEEIDYINVHGTSTPLGDISETMAIKTVFGTHASRMNISSTKSMTGHLLGGAGGLEAGITVLALRDQILPPTINLENQDPGTGSMDFIPNQARKAEVEYATISRASPTVSTRSPRRWDPLGSRPCWWR